MFARKSPKQNEIFYTVKKVALYSLIISVAVFDVAKFVCFCSRFLTEYKIFQNNIVFISRKSGKETNTIIITLIPQQYIQSYKTFNYS